MDSFLQNTEKIDIKTFTIKKSVKKTKMNKETKLNIQRVIHDIILDGNISEDEMENPSPEIRNLIFNIVLTIESKKTISCEEEEEIKDCIVLHLRKSIKVVAPTYDDSEIEKLKDIIYNLKKIPQPEQRTPEWYEFRGNRLTASDLSVCYNH